MRSRASHGPKTRPTAPQGPLLYREVHRHPQARVAVGLGAIAAAAVLLGFGRPLLEAAVTAVLGQVPLLVATARWPVTEVRPRQIRLRTRRGGSHPLLPRMTRWSLGPGDIARVRVLPHPGFDEGVPRDAHAAIHVHLAEEQRKPAPVPDLLVVQALAPRALRAALAAAGFAVEADGDESCPVHDAQAG